MIFFLGIKTEPKSKIKKIKILKVSGVVRQLLKKGEAGDIVCKCLIIRLFCDRNGHLIAKYSLFLHIYYLFVQHLRSTKLSTEQKFFLLSLFFTPEIAIK